MSSHRLTSDNLVRRISSQNYWYFQDAYLAKASGSPDFSNLDPPELRAFCFQLLVKETPLTGPSSELGEQFQLQTISGTL